MSVVVREWTPIGTEGFEYFWSETPDPAAGMPFISWKHPMGFQARAFIPQEDADDTIVLGWLLDQKTLELEASYRALIR